MTISQGLVKVVFGSKENGQSHFVWWRISLTKWQTVVNRLGSQTNLYYAKIYDYKRLGRKKGNVGKQIGYVYWDKDGILSDKKM